MTDLSAIDREYREIGPTNLEVWRSEYEKYRSPLLPFVESMWDAAGPHSALCLAQQFLENIYATTGIIIQANDYNPLSMRPWLEDPTATVQGDVLMWDTRTPLDDPIRVPPGAIGAVYHPQGGMFLRFSDPVAAVKEWRRRIIDDRAYKGGIYNDAHTLAEMLAHYAPPEDTHPVTGVTNKAAEYEKVVRAKLGEFYAVEQMAPREEPVMALKTYRFVGLDRDVYLPDDIEVIIDIVPDKYIGWVRSGVGNAPDYSTWHDTGAPGQNAWAQRNYLHGGPRDQNRNVLKVGFNFAVDDTRIIQLTPLNETTWAAGTTDGNRTSWHVEQCFGGTINWDRSLRNAAALHGGLIAAMPGWELEPSLVQHNVWYGKDCPGQIRHMGLWPKAVGMAREFFDAARAAAEGKAEPAPAPAPAFPNPVPIPDVADNPPYVKLAEGAEMIRAPWKVKARVATPRLRYAARGSAKIGEDIPAGAEFTTAYLIINRDGSRYLYTPFATRVAWDDVDVVGAA